MKDPIAVLIVDDEDGFRRVLSAELRRLHYEVAAVESGAEALSRVQAGPPDVALVDLQMPEMDGLELMRRLMAGPEPPEIIVVTGHPSIATAIEAMKNGALDYVTKPFELEELTALIDHAAERRRLRTENALLRQELAGREWFAEIVGSSAVMQRALGVVSKVAGTDATALVQGESGTGKELIARAIHKGSARREHPFIVVDCCSLQENLLENELFGHEEGAYTGATRLKHGLFEVADRGTLFMDEIGEVSPEIQARLLRVLETGVFRRVGGTRDVGVDVRLIAATNRNLAEMTAAEKFRPDLLYRLNLVTITVPPLRERPEDIEPLVRHFMANSRVPGAESKGISPAALALLRDYPWPGNVRELKNAIERALILGDQPTLDAGDFNLAPRRAPTETEAGLPPEGKWLTLEEMERLYIQKALTATQGHRRQAADLLGISERNLYRKLKDLGE